MEVLVTQTTYQLSGRDTDINIFGRSEHGNRIQLILKGIEPYFYTNDEPEQLPDIKRFEKTGVNLHGRRLWKVFTYRPGDVPKVRSRFLYHYEADIPFADRAMIDCGVYAQIRVPDDRIVIGKDDIVPVKQTIMPEVVNFDIETDDSQGFANAEAAERPVRSIALYSSQIDKFIVIIEGKVDKNEIREEFHKMQKYFSDKTEIIIKMANSEAEIFKKFTEVLNAIKPDILTGWNVINYDIAYLTNRAKIKHYNTVNFKEYSQFDMMRGYDELSKNKTYAKLEHCAQQTLGTGKLPREKINEMFEQNKEKLCIYNLWDVELVRRINNVKNILGCHLNWSWFAGARIEDTGSKEKLFDKYVLHQIAGVVVAPSKEMLRTGVNLGVDKGAFVMDPSMGKFKFVCVLDFTSMYPFNILSANISPETKVQEGDIEDKSKYFWLPSGRYYRKEPKGLIPMIVEKLIKARAKLKDEMKKYPKDTKEYKALWEEQRATKYFTNAAYGVLGSSIFRLADGDVASDVTLLGRTLIQFTIEEVEKMGFNPLYADTDSVIFETGVNNVKNAMEVGQEVANKLNPMYKELAKTWNGEKECIHNIKSEKIFEHWIQFGTKKRYVGSIGWDTDTEEKFLVHLPIEKRLEVKGFEIVRANASKLTKKAQKEVVIIALEKDDYKKEIIAYLKDIHQKFYNGELDVEMLLPAHWNKEFSEYKSKPAHVRAIIYSIQNEMLDVHIGDPFSWLYIKGLKDKREPTDVIALDFDAEDVPNYIKIDYDKMWQRTIEKPLTNIIEGLGIQWDEITSDTKQTSLGDYF